MKDTLEEKIKIGYEEYLKLPLSTIREHTELYNNQWCIRSGRGVVGPDPHRYYTFIEFTFYCGKKENLFERFIK